MTPILKNFMVPSKLMYPVSVSWAIHSFTMVFESMICEYRHNRYRDLRYMKKLFQKLEDADKVNDDLLA